MKYPSWLNPLRGTQLHWLLPLTFSLLKFVAVNAPVTLEVFVHDGFGARTGKSLLKGFLLLLIMAPTLRMACPYSLAPLFGCFVVAYGALALCEWSKSRLRSTDDHVHSLQHGEPWRWWDSLPVSRSMVECCLEPVLCGIVACLISLFDPALALWIHFAAVVLSAKAILHEHDVRTHQFDTLDSRMESARRAPRPRAENDAFVEARPASPRRRRDDE